MAIFGEGLLLSYDMKMEANRGTKRQNVKRSCGFLESWKERYRNKHGSLLQ